MWVLIGCPVYAREWILPYWFRAIEQQDFPLDQVGFIFEVAPDDHHTVDALFCWHGRHPEVRCFDVRVNTEVQHRAHLDGGPRNWNHTRYATMVLMRNKLLDRVCCMEPDRYFSLDTDMLLSDPTTISQLVTLTEELEAVAPLAYMTKEGTEFPNVMTWIPGVSRAARQNPYPLGTVFPADVIMACKMMRPEVYQRTRYRHHTQGEDLGWSQHCRELGFKLWSASHIYVPHVMHPSMLPGYLEHGDSRGDVANFRRLVPVDDLVGPGKNVFDALPSGL